MTGPGLVVYRQYSEESTDYYLLFSRLNLLQSFSIVNKKLKWPLIFITLLANSADDKLIIFFLVFPKKNKKQNAWHFM